MGKGPSHTILLVCALKALLNQISKTFSNTFTTGESSPYSSLVITKILHFHNICYRHPLQCTVSSLCPINPLFVQNKLRPSKGFSFKSRTPSTSLTNHPELMNAGFYTWGRGGAGVGCCEPNWKKLVSFQTIKSLKLIVDHTFLHKKY